MGTCPPLNFTGGGAPKKGEGCLKLRGRGVKNEGGKGENGHKLRKGEKGGGKET